MIVCEITLEYLLNKNNFPLYKNKVGIQLSENDFRVDKVPERVTGDDECSTASLKLCKLDNALFSCSSCKQILSQCVHFATDFEETSNRRTIPANKTGEGYCLPLSDNRTSRKCTAKNGGKWVLVSDQKNINYTFVCLCTKQAFFVKKSLESDCDQFLGCRNGVIANPDTWTTFDTIQCECASTHDSVPGNLQTPGQCVLKNIFRHNYHHFIKIAKRFVAPEYLEMVGEDVILPNPCQFDIVTRTFNPNIGKIMRYKTHVFCMATDSHYIEVVQTDDYLFHNQGTYANAIMRIMVDNPVHSIYIKDVVYEVHRKNKRFHDLPLSGRRVAYSDCFIQLPFFEKSSRNMGNPNGELYEYQPTAPLGVYHEPRVLIYSGRKPLPIKFVFGNTLSWVPAFMATRIRNSYRVFNGNLAYVNLQLLNNTSMFVVYPVTPATCASRYLGTEGLNGEYDDPKIESSHFTQYYAMPMISLNNEIQPYTPLFTGTILTYERQGTMYTKPLSPGLLVLCMKYRQRYDHKWTSFKSSPSFKAHFIDCPQSVANSFNTHMFTENAFTYEQNEIGTPSKFASQYKFDDDGTVKFAKKLN